MEIAREIRETSRKQYKEAIAEFSICIPAGDNRFKFGVGDERDFIKLWNCKSPNKMKDISVDIEKPRALPDCCALVVRQVPLGLH
jgi:hypothetical protein